jgi:hypothetical protein
MLVEQTKIVTGLAPITPSTSTPDYVSLKGYDRMTAIIVADNGTPVTGSAITLKQATAVAGTGEKALAFTKQWANADTGASDALTETAVTSNTFTTATTADKNLLYVLEVMPEDLDQVNNFDCVRVGTGDAANTVLSVLYILWPAKHARSTPLTAITD